MDSTSKNDRDEQTLCKNVNLAHRQRHLMEGHLKAMSRTLLAVYLVTWQPKNPLAQVCLQ